MDKKARQTPLANSHRSLYNTDHAIQSLGTWRSGFLWRLFGICVLLSFLHALGGFGDAVPWRFVPYSVYLSCAAAFLLICLGPSLLRLTLLTLCLFAYFIPVMTEWVWFQLSEEFGLFLILPVLGFSFTAVVQLKNGTRDEEDAMQVFLFRWAAQKPKNKWFQEWLTLQGPQRCIH